VLGVLYTLLASASFGINSATLRRGVITGTVTQVVAISMPIGLLMFVLAAAALGQLTQIGQFSNTSLEFFACAGVVHFVVGRYCSYRSVQAMGANLAAPVAQWSLLVTLVLAVVFLHERLDLLKAIGIGLLVLGPALVIAAQRARGRRSQLNAKPLEAAKLSRGWSRATRSAFSAASPGAHRRSSFAPASKVCPCLWPPASSPTPRQRSP
jgi:uncharacterized membrane protein